MDETFQGSNKSGTTDLFFKLGIGQSAKLAMVKARNELELKIPLLDKVNINSIVMRLRPFTLFAITHTP